MQEKQFVPTASIKIIGVGGSGTNSVNNMIQSNLQGAEFYVANTDKQALENSLTENRIHLGNEGDNKDSARGLGAGADPKIGEAAAQNSLAEIKAVVKGSDMVIITAGMGGGTGTGAAPIVAEAAKSAGALVVAIVTTPFMFEGNKRKNNALEGIDKLKSKVDSIITISNDKLLEQFGDVPLNDSFVYADTILKQTVKTLTDIIGVPARINLDFADVKTVMANKGNAIVGIGRATGKDRAASAAVHAISSPIIENSIKGASDAIINISGSNVTLKEINTAVAVITEATGKDTNIIFGTKINDSNDDEMYVSVIATGIDTSRKITSVEQKTEVIELVKTLEIEYEKESTKEFLLDDPLPASEKLSLTSKILQTTHFDLGTKTNETTLNKAKKSKLPNWFSKKDN
ncbi:cell division protein FtsZ [Mycoplasma testudineum]|uniref:Cell division protein FtsZ n=1 Tax=Mycoplasma testudineum TaxID=244584 RepID=A0A4R6IH42_9MOLU|nr:cell division protein FtsZ [Mycoplasma testudineum]OYD27086.1 cell division protein FtsZ [Mycoplasma testudineum]TDO21161.1 cell division protein FtsZ [Mycoplasma testudineum]